MKRLLKIAIADIESNIVEKGGKKYFSAGKHFGLTEFTRDLSISGVLALNRLYPEIMISSLEYTREVRLSIGLTVSKDHPIEGLNAKVSDLEEHEFIKAHSNAASVSRRSDDVVWLWAAGDLFSARPDDEKGWRWLYETGGRCFRELYDPFYDSEDGLFRGQAVFVDVTYSDALKPAFCSEKVTGYPLHFTASDCVRVKALSTNCLYFQAMQVMARAALKQGRDKEAFHWHTRAECLKLAIHKHLGQPDGTYAYYKGADGKPADRRDALGSALAVLFGVVSPEEGKAVLRDYPVTDKGIPLFHPFFPGNHFYHNNSAWPFVDTLFLKALEKCEGKSRVEQSAALLARTCTDEGTFFEVTDWRDGKVKGSPRQLWTASAFVDVYSRGL